MKFTNFYRINFRMVMQTMTCNNSQEGLMILFSMLNK